MFVSLLLQAAATVTQVASKPSPGSHIYFSQPNTVALPYATFQGATMGNVTQYLGIPFAQPPVRSLRFQRPKAPHNLLGLQNATAFGAPSASYSNISEDCLTINVLKPASTGKDEKLPLAFWIHGGGFEIGDATDTSLLPLMERSIAVGEPVISVIANYRLNGFGFLAGKEVQEAGIANLGIHDQRLALDWVQDNIAAFGGDPDKVVVWGISAGAISVALHLVPVRSQQLTVL